MDFKKVRWSPIQRTWVGRARPLQMWRCERHGYFPPKKEDRCPICGRKLMAESPPPEAFD